MPTPPPQPPPLNITQMANAANHDAEAGKALLAAVYEQLKRLARGRVAGDRAGQSLGATDLVHLVYEKLCLSGCGPAAGGDATERTEDGTVASAPRAPAQWQNRRHFFYTYGKAMRHVLVDHARRRQRRQDLIAGAGAEAHGRPDANGNGNGQPDAQAELFAPTCVGDLISRAAADDVVAMDQAVHRLRQSSPDAYKVVLLKFYSGLTTAETAVTLGWNEKKVQRRWDLAREILFADVTDNPRSGRRGDAKPAAKPDAPTDTDGKEQP